MKEKILELLYKYRIDFSNDSAYTEFGIREEDFKALAEELEKLKTEDFKQWWNNLPDITLTTNMNKSALCEKYYGNRRIHKSLRDIEILKIYNSEIGSK